MALLELKGIVKFFGPVPALRGVDLSVEKAEVHALIGENGAGKSTLMKVLSGAHRADGGSMYFDGRPLTLRDPAGGRRMGIGMIYQELNIASHLTVAENVSLGMEPSRLGMVRLNRRKIRECLALLGHPDLNLDRPAGEYPIALQQILEIARSLYSEARLIIMDEPTSSLTAADTRALFKVIRTLVEQGIAVIYISHFLEEVREIAQRITVLRDGQSVMSGSMAELSMDQIVKSMVGRSIEEMYPRIPHEIGEVVLETYELQGCKWPRQASFRLRRGEVLGVAGLVGSGRTETLRCIFGLDPLSAGKVQVGGRELAGSSSAGRSLRAGMDLLSENRKEEGLAVKLSLVTNITLSGLKRYASGGFLNLRREREAAEFLCGEVGVKCRSPLDPATSLSGGNQQKLAIARMLHMGGDILLLDEPTRGIDVGSKAEIYRIILGLAARGKAVIVVSSYLPELLGICDSLAVMYRGVMSPVLPVGQWREDRIMHYATSGKWTGPQES